MEVNKFLYFVLVNFNMILISLLTAYFIVYIPYWSTMNSR